jgi:hypothetical protein
MIWIPGPGMPHSSLAEALLSGKAYFGPALRAMQGVATRHQYFAPVISFLARLHPR